MIVESAKTNIENTASMDQQVKASVEILVPVAGKFTLNFHPQEEGLGEEYSITLDVLQDPDRCGSASFLPLKLTMESGDNADLINRCLDVLKAGYITAKGDLVIDHQKGVEGSSGRCVHLMHVHWFEPVNPCRQIEEAPSRAEGPGIEYIGGRAA